MDHAKCRRARLIQAIAAGFAAPDRASHLAPDRWARPFRNFGSTPLSFDVRSNNTTVSPRRAASQAWARPTIPPPTIATSTDGSAIDLPRKPPLTNTGPNWMLEVQSFRGRPDDFLGGNPPSCSVHVTVLGLRLFAREATDGYSGPSGLRSDNQIRRKSTDTRMRPRPAYRRNVAARPPENSFVPDVRMDIESFRAIKPKANKIAGCHVVAGFGERYDKCPGSKGKNSLSAVGMIIGVPEQHASPAGARAVRRPPKDPPHNRGDSVRRPPHFVRRAHRLSIHR